MVPQLKQIGLQLITVEAEWWINGFIILFCLFVYIWNSPLKILQKGKKGNAKENLVFSPYAILSLETMKCFMKTAILNILKVTHNTTLTSYFISFCIFPSRICLCFKSLCREGPGKGKREETARTAQNLYPQSSWVMTGRGGSSRRRRDRLKDILGANVTKTS